tara:strand:+ start:1796 stop:2593 length:798 start_codon:yes stop_codon:yes gene_type:complete
LKLKGLAGKMRIKDKVALITGSASGVRPQLMGFGGVTAWLFSEEGAKVVIADINAKDGETTARQIRDSGGEALFNKLDVTNESDWIKSIKSTITSFGKIDILVNNAGTTARENVENTTIEMWDSQMEIHAKGTFLGTKSVIPELRRSGGGSIVNVSSIAGIIGSHSSTAYHAGKGAIRAFTKSAAVQYASEGIRVNSVHPGYVDTPMTHNVFSDHNQAKQRTSTIPMGRFGTAKEIAYAILYLASDESSYVTGTELIVDGGTTAH